MRLLGSAVIADVAHNGLPVAAKRQPVRHQRRRSTHWQYARVASGYTFVDVVVTVLIVGILAAIASPRVSHTLHRYRAESAAQRIKADLGLARTTAIAASAPRTVKFSTATNDYKLPGIADSDRRRDAYSVDLAAAPMHAKLISASLGGDSDVQFDRYGQPDSGGTITVQAGSHQRTVTIDPDTGKASLP